MKVSPFFAMLIGFGLAYWFYIADPSLPAALAEQQPPLYRFLLNKWYFDEIYDFIFVRPAHVARAPACGRGATARRSTASINGVAMGIVPSLTRLAGRAQSGYVFHYAFAMVIGLAAS